MRALVTASFVTPPFLGAIAWELLAAPNSGLLNKLYRFVTGAEMGEHLFNIYTLTGLIFVISCYTFPYVFVLVANALDRIPGDLEDASSMLGGGTWTTARRITIPLALAGAARRRADRVPAGDDAVRLAGDPGAAGRLPHHDDQDLEPVPVPPKPELAAAASLPLLVLTVMLLRAPAHDPRPQGLFGGRRQDRRSAADPARQLEMAGARRSCFVVLMLPVFLPYFALFNAAFSPIATTLVTPDNATLHNIWFTFFELSSTKLALQEHVHARRADGDDRHAAGAGDRLSRRRARRSRPPARSASSPPRRSPSRASCSASACS